ncbi:tyrosinase family protein [Chitinophaga sancti]|uniref:Tyrosinase n=1 Tax=Chitinophaga sancti TaxID=1004 RepID=A0A1K1RX50_9BACT|nr:tyrosinase family protein [Chitinophaga sancti]WQD63995.1 tyrosinase family protein [Chitinophaga sancti]WQG90381.1 tyrosinase family protein [Chitinophaga sancti]SFW76397.1 tyrosinase [Chitinophaga sancti]
MTTFTRRNAWNNNGTFDNSDLLWYAKAVHVMQSLPVNHPNSWWFYAAIHGEFLLNPIPPPPPLPDYTYLNWVNISYISPTAQLNTLPSQNLITLFWNQCQHGTWYFLPWHRGYLVAIENILRDIIVNQLNGPADWALPYWNYLNKSENKIPPAFTAQFLPDNTPNPLLVPQRYGLRVDVGNRENEANDECQWDTIFSEDSTPAQPGPGDIYGYYYGGGETEFSHDPNSPETGDLEQNPHNFVHGMVGGQNNKKMLGLMGVPDTAALDPVFYLHHANIDRMWTAWNVTGENENSTESSWLAGPSSQGNSLFAMPLDAAGTPWYYSPEDVINTRELKYSGSIYSYSYDDLSLTSYDKTPPKKVRENILGRLNKLGVIGTLKDIKMPKITNSELVGASSDLLKLSEGEVNTTVLLDTNAWKPVSKSFLKASVNDIPDEIFIQLEGVKGGGDANFLSIYVNQKFVKSISLFGLLAASIKNGIHGDAGLTFKINITNIIDDLQLENNVVDLNSLDIRIKAKNPIPDGDEIRIGRIGIYRVEKKS